MTACKYPQVRNYRTGRCRKPCAKHQARSPTTGRCVTKTFLKAMKHRGDLTNSQYRKAINDDGVLRRSQVVRNRSRSSGISPYGDFNFTKYDYKQPRRYKSGEPNLVYDKGCAPRFLNLDTGRCKAACAKGQVRSPNGDHCVSESYVRALYPKRDDYDTDDDDYDAANIMWTPTDFQSTTIHKNRDMINLINNSAIGVADLQHMYGIRLGVVDPRNPREFVMGIYDPRIRQNCNRNTLMNLVGTPETKCGISNIGFDVNELSRLFDTQGPNQFVFVALQGNSVPTPDFINAYIGYFGGSATNHKLLLVGNEGVWKILYRGIPSVPALSPLAPNFMDGVFDVSHFEAAAIRLNAMYMDRINFSFHAFTDQTRGLK